MEMFVKPVLWSAALLMLGVIGLSACSGGEPVPEPAAEPANPRVATEAREPSATPRPAISPTNTPEPTPVPPPTSTPEPPAAPEPTPPPESVVAPTPLTGVGMG